MIAKITIQETINKPVKIVWEKYTTPKDIMKWNNASDDWHTPSSTNDLRVGGKFVSRMEAKDGSMGFDFGGVYTKVIPFELIEYSMSKAPNEADSRKVSVKFTQKGDETLVEVIFDSESSNPIEMQRNGWQSILNNFKKYTERK